MDRLEVLTLNCWGIWGLSRNLDMRMDAIGNKLAEEQYDIVALQEVFHERHFHHICSKTNTAYPYSHYFHGPGFFGFGCALLSKYPIEDVYFHCFHINGYFWRGFTHNQFDWWTGKGIGYAKVCHPRGLIHCFINHSHADYAPGAPHTELRCLQMMQLVDLVKQTTQEDDFVILMGDFNQQEHEISLRAFKTLCDVDDTYHCTFSKPEPFHTYGHDLKDVKEGVSLRRIDFIFISKTLSCEQMLLKFENIEGTDEDYSDHKGVAATLKFQPSIQPIAALEEKLNILTEVYGIIKHGEEKARSKHWLAATLIMLVLVLLSGLLAVAVDFSLIVSHVAWLHGQAILLWLLSSLIAVISTSIICVMGNMEANAYRTIGFQLDFKVKKLRHQIDLKKER